MDTRSCSVRNIRRIEGSAKGNNRSSERRAVSFVQRIEKKYCFFFFFFFVDLEDFYSVSDRFFNTDESTEWIGYLNELFDCFVDPDCGEIFFLS